MGIAAHNSLWQNKGEIFWNGVKMPPKTHRETSHKATQTHSDPEQNPPFSFQDFIPAKWGRVIPWRENNPHRCAWRERWSTRAGSKVLMEFTSRNLLHLNFCLGRRLWTPLTWRMGGNNCILLSSLRSIFFWALGGAWLRLLFPQQQIMKVGFWSGLREMGLDVGMNRDLPEGKWILDLQHHLSDLVAHLSALAGWKYLRISSIIPRDLQDLSHVGSQPYSRAKAHPHVSLLQTFNNSEFKDLFNEDCQKAN